MVQQSGEIDIATSRACFIIADNQFLRRSSPIAYPRLYISHHVSAVTNATTLIGYAGAEGSRLAILQDYKMSERPVKRLRRMSTEEDDDIDNDDFEELLGAVKTDRER